MDIQDYEVFCRAASEGIVKGLNHRYEWYLNATKALNEQGLAPPEHEQHAAAIDSAFLNFERTLASSPDTEFLYRNMTIQGLQERVNKFYTESQVKERRKS